MDILTTIVMLMGTLGVLLIVILAIPGGESIPGFMVIPRLLSLTFGLIVTWMCISAVWSVIGV